MAVTEDEWAALGAARYVSLGTYRRSGVVVPTAVWVAPLEDALVVTTEGTTGKAKRLRNDSRVVLRPCSRTGAVAPGALTVHAVGAIAGPAEDHPAASAALRSKYGVQFALYLAIERVIHRIRRKPGDPIVLRITRG